jgi:hypothetical protein
MKKLLLSLSLALTLSPCTVLAADSTADLKAQLEEAMRTIKDLQSRVVTLEQQQTQRAAAPAAAAPAASGSIPTAQGGVLVYAPESAAVKTEPDPNKARVEFTGKIQMDYIYDFKRVNPDWNATLRPSQIACDGESCGKNGESIFSARQTSLGFKGYVPTDMGQLKTDLSFDLFGSGGGGATDFRLLNAWAELGKVGIGQYYTLFMNVDTFPNIIDYWGPNGMVFIRNPQIRYTPYDSGDGVKVAVSLESPYAAIDTGKLTLIDPNLDVKTHSRYPDLAAKFSVERDWGQVQVAGVLRSLGFEAKSGTGVERDGTKTGWGVNLSGWLKTVDRDRITGQVVYGEGIASYMNDGGVDIGPNAALRAETVPTLGVFLYYDHYWSDKWSSSIGGSIHRQDNTENQDDKAFKQGSYASTNLLWYPAKNVLGGAELLFGRLELKDGSSFNDTRLQFSGQYKF